MLSAVDKIPILSAVALQASSDVTDILIELNCNGATFDLRHGASISSSRLNDKSKSNAGVARDAGEVPTEIFSIAPSHHVRSAQSSIPIVKMWWLTAAELSAELKHCVGVIWGPSAERLFVNDFQKQAEEWTESGAFPASGLVKFVDDLDDGLKTHGLSFFAGQELRIEPELADDRDWAKRLGSRLVQTLIHREKITVAEEFVAPDGSKLKLVPSSNGKFVRAWRA